MCRYLFYYHLESLQASRNFIVTNVINIIYKVLRTRTIFNVNFKRLHSRIKSELIKITCESIIIRKNCNSVIKYI